MIRFFAALMLAAGLAQTPAAAQEGGIAFAYAPEQGSGHCVAGSPEKALACARQKCVESGGALPEDCARVAWCYPAGWTVSVGVQHKEGIHWAEFSCGWPNKDAAVAAGKLLCDHQDKAMIQNCHVGVVYDPTGKEIILE